MNRAGDFVRSMPTAASGFAPSISHLQRLHIDGPLLLALLAICGFGLTILYSASGQHGPTMLRQTGFIVAGFIAMLTIAQINMRFIRRWSILLYLLGVALLVAVIFYGSGAKGAVRWIDLPGLPRFQPSEIMKVALPLTVATYLSGRSMPPSFFQVLVCVVLIGIPTLLIGAQPDLGTSLLVAVSGLFVLYFAGLSWYYVLAVVAAVGVSSPLIWTYVLHAYQKQRILTLLDPEADKLGAGWNIIQSKTAIGSGGWQGKGWMNGTQSQLDFLPESHTDFIIAVLAEELGLFGVLVLISLYLVIIGCGVMIGLRAQDTFSRLVVGSITLTFFVYAFVNMGMVSGLLPVVGVPLPFISQGGTSIITLLAGFGLLMAVSTEAKRITR